jgi:enoyl-CoA hydratase/carnithine racemase
MSSEGFTFTTEGRLAHVTLNRPDARNAMSRGLMRGLTRLARELSDRTDLDAVIVSGAGSCFSAGADLKDSQAWGAAASFAERRESAMTGYKLCQAWEALPQITIVAIEGYAVGGGLAWSLACDWRVMAADAFVSLPEIALGIPLTWGAIPRLVSLVGPARAKRLTILCERVPAEQALAMGLVDELTAPGQALAAAEALAGRTLAMPPVAVRMSKETVNAVATALYHLGGHMAHDQIALAVGSDDSRAARAAALRPPKPRV